MSVFWVYFNTGFHYILSAVTYFTLLVLVLLAAPYMFKDWKKILILLGFFTLGHCISLMLSLYDIIVIKPYIIKFIIPIAILFTALYNIFTSGKSGKKTGISFISFTMLTFGAFYGLSFSNYIEQMITDAQKNKLIVALGFESGVIAAQLLAVIGTLLLSFIIQNFLRFSKRDWIIMTAALITGIILPVIINS